MVTELLGQLSLLEKQQATAIVDLSLNNNPEESSKCVWSYATLYESIINAADDLKRQGVKEKSVVAIAIPNSIEYVVCFLAVGAVGAVAAPLNPAYKPTEFAFYTEDAGATFLIIDQQGNAAAEQVARESSGRLSVLRCEIAVSGTDSPGIRIKGDKTLSEAKSEHDGPSTEGESPAMSPNTATPKSGENTNKANLYHLLVHTSGTTSRPKAVPLTHENLSMTVQNIVNTYDLEPQDKTLLVMPLFHVHGLLCGLLATLSSGGTVIIPANKGKFSASQFWKDVCKWNVTWFTAVPTILQVLLARAGKEFPPEGCKPPSLRFIRSCSACLPPSLIPQLESVFKAPVLEAYAMSEAAHQICSNPLPARGSRKPGSVGLPQNVNVAILDPESSAVLKTGEVGEVGIRGANVMTGYLNNPEANVEAFQEGWFHTGDLGHLDADGYLTLVGRKKEIINRGGEKISPAEVDDCLLQHPHIAEAVTFGIPDPKYGESVGCAIRLKDSLPATQKLTPQDVQNFCKERLAEFKIPDRVIISDAELPKTATGKVQRRIVAAHFIGA